MNLKIVIALAAVLFGCAAGIVWAEDTDAVQFAAYGEIENVPKVLYIPAGESFTLYPTVYCGSFDGESHDHYTYFPDAAFTLSGTGLVIDGRTVTVPNAGTYTLTLDIPTDRYRSVTQTIKIITTETAEYDAPSNLGGVAPDAFMWHGELTSVTLPEWCNCPSFAYCVSLASVQIPSDAHEIPDGAFVGCSSLESVEIPEYVQTIGNCAFAGCTSLASIYIPASVSTIGEYAFLGCTSLAEIVVDPNNEYFESEDGVLYDKGKTRLIAYPAGKSGSFTIPASVTGMGEYLFEG